MKVLAVNPGHNGSACLVEDGKIIFYLEEERLSRFKYDGNPFRAALEALQNHKVDYLILGGTSPEQYPTMTWTGEGHLHAFARKFNPDIRVINMSTNHHLGHAAAGFYNSGFDEALCVVVDGAGSIKSARNGTENTAGFETESVFKFAYPGTSECLYQSLAQVSEGADIFKKSLSSSLRVPIVKAYEAVTRYLGWSYIEAGKTMGLAPYGELDPNMPDLFEEDGRCNMDLIFPQYPSGAMLNTETPIGEYFRAGDPESTHWHRDPSKVTTIAKDLAWKVQDETQRLVGDLIEKFVGETGIKKVCISGGYGLNCVANYYFRERFPDVDFFIDPIAHDGGTTIGLALLSYYRETKSTEAIKLESVYLGPESSCNYSAVDDLDSEKYSVIDASAADVAKLIADNNIVSQFQGRSEGGPRALGNRSILYNPGDVNGKDHVNTVKGREWFRPFAGSMLHEYFEEWFETRGIDESPFMMYAMNVKKDKVDLIPSITHVDGTCRIQTVKKSQNENYYDLINEFFKITGIPILFNTSFNLAGDPLVETLDDALNTVGKSDIKYLYLPDINKLIVKNEV